MLISLQIKNIILIEDEEILFRKGLNVLTGETGSGKSAILKALLLIAGERGDSSLIRHGFEKGQVEALFEINSSHYRLLEVLAEGGIEVSEEQLIIRREIASSGKGRIYLNQQLIQLSFLKKISQFLIHVVGQHASQQLFSLDYHRETLDLYGDLSPLREEYQKSYLMTNQLKETIETIKSEEAKRLRTIDHYRSEIEELDEANLQEGEEERLFSDYSLLANAEEIASKMGEINETLSGERGSLLVLIKRQKQLLESIVRYDEKLNEFSLSLNSLFLELQELSRSISFYYASLEIDPERLQAINSRLTLLNRLKKKYGGSFEALLLYQKEVKEKLKVLESKENELELLERELIEKEEKTETLAAMLTLEREKSSLQLERALSNELHSLNMTHAQIRLSVTAQKRGLHGKDRIEILMTPNLGEPEISLLEQASGGEVARVLLALHTLLIGKKPPFLLVFDEIDANIGGATATIVGEKFLQISKNSQVIGITHFAQVASKADHHLKISKIEKKGRTLSTVEEISHESLKEREALRMKGYSLY